jgi:hypothetical protein
LLIWAWGRERSAVSFGPKVFWFFFSKKNDFLFYVSVKPVDLLSISLIICSRGRPDSLARTLDGVAFLRHPAFEVIAVIDPGDLETASCVARHAPAARVGACQPANLAMARNVGLAMARGDIVAFLDDDAVPEPDWLDRLETAYGDPKVSAAGGFIRGRDGIKFQYRVVLIDEFGGDHKVRLVPRRLAPGWFVSLTGTNFSARRAAALAVGGFDENYPYFLEETDFLLRLAAQGGRIAVVPEAEIYHFQASSALRDARGVPASLEIIARSKAYYCVINRRPVTSAADVTKALDMFSGQKTRRIRAHVRAGRVTEAQAAGLLAGLESGLRAGRKLAEVGRNLPRLDPDNGVFAGLGPAARPARGRLCVLLDAVPLAQARLREIREIAGEDVEVTVMGNGAGLRSVVGFEAGIWRHEIGLAQRVLHGGTAGAVLAEMRRILARRRFDAVHVAAESPALARAAKASGLPRFSPAA